MATVDVSPVSLSARDRKLVIDALQLRIAQLRRNLQAETNPNIVKIRSDESEEISSLIVKFR